MAEKKDQKKTSSKSPKTKITVEEIIHDIFEIGAMQTIPTIQKIESALILANEFLGTDTAAIGLISGNSFLIRCAISTGTRVKTGSSYSIHDTFCLRICQTNERLTIKDMKEEGYEGQTCYKKFGYETYLGVPLLIDNNVVGTLHVAHSKKKKRPFTKSAIDFMDSLAAWISYELKVEEDKQSSHHQITALQKENIELGRKCRALEELSSFVSHDLKHPLRAINGFLELFLDNVGAELTESSRTFIDEALESADYMNVLLDDLLDYIETDKSRKQTKKIDPNALIDSVLKRLKDKIEQTSASVTYDELPIIYYNDSLFVRLLSNLIENAIKYCSDEAPEIHVEGYKKGENWLFSVTDNGIGIPDTHTEKIFTMFERLHTKEDTDGTGIGLAICRKIVESYDGQIWVEGRKDSKGSIFKFTVPIDSHGYEIKKAG